MKRLSVFLFLMIIALCGLYGYSFWIFERNHSEVADADLKTTETNNMNETHSDRSDEVDSTNASVKETATTKVVDGAYLLKLEQDQLCVYQVSDQSKYMSLDLSSLCLSDELKQEYEIGVYVDDEQALYSVLESISS